MVHLQENGFDVRSTDLPSLRPLKAARKIPAQLSSCHTALVDSFIVEGHVPAADVRRLLRERPRVLGIAVPGMPIGSPGMEGPRPVPYEVFTFDANGKVAVFSRHRP